MQLITRRGALGAIGLGLAATAGGAMAAVEGAPPVSKLRVTVLSTMLADAGLGEWGYAALVEVGDTTLLFDTGAHPEVVLANAREMKIDLSGVETVVLSHNHGDHTGGLLALRKALMAANPRAMGVAHVGAGVFSPRLGGDGRDHNGLSPIRAAYEQLGGRFVEHAGPTQLAPGAWLTGPVPRPNDERNWQPGLRLQGPDGGPGPEDNVPEDSSLVFDTTKGLVVLTGCGHAGAVNICQYARDLVRPAPIECLIGGLHLFAASDAKIDWTAAKLKAMGVRHLLAGHCTGIEATYRLRAGLGLTRATAVVSAVGSGYSLDEGLRPGAIAA
ncbi:metal-dependent hydrolase, beta-lactamase superfamily II [Caulobacter sp. AP07]|uniref:MBL fold metallo-hydrolase n=1 Tax=Caulobacter sp. AP07 TaxID=1144304 RepID=UPI000272206C|nr:MBL fold metallo-hydrolase [Caulobacter sp. AP07]EJL29214.1 metal-dependent hydrolase, beta-lactamase superfamily II [Caulobacter sp. AP07]